MFLLGSSDLLLIFKFKRYINPEHPSGGGSESGLEALQPVFFVRRPKRRSAWEAGPSYDVPAASRRRIPTRALQRTMFTLWHVTVAV